MVTDEMIDAAIRANTNAKLFGGEPRDWVRAALEAALSAAEPVDYQLVFSDGRTSRVLYSKDEAERFKKASDITVDIRALYAAPPSPSVAVKALEWNASDSWNISKTIIGTYVVRPCLATNFLGQWLLRRAQSEGSDKTLYASEDEAKAVAQGDYEARIHSVLSAQVQDVATHRHKKRGSEYVLIGVGKMQAEDWFDWPDKTVAMEAVDMREVAIYRSVDDGSLWVRPVEEFNDGRFETLPAAPAKQEGGE